MSRIESAENKIAACITLVTAVIQASTMQTMMTILLSRRVLKSQNEPLHFSEVIELAGKAVAVTR